MIHRDLTLWTYILISIVFIIIFQLTFYLPKTYTINFTPPPDELSLSSMDLQVLGETSAKTCPGISYLDVLLDKSISIPQDYEPLDLVNLTDRNIPSLPNQKLRTQAADQMNLMLENSRKDGFSFMVYSAYRSYETQKAVFAKWNRRAAPPGHSEHQLGTAVDLALINGQSIYPSPVWNWLDQNAHKFGFVMSYRFKQEGLTGYVFEPWHWRFVGVDLATKVRMSSEIPQSFYRKIECI